MPRVLLPALLPAVLPAVLAVVLVAGGCGDADDPGSRAEQDRESPRAAPSAAPSPDGPTATPSRSTPTATSSLAAKPSKGVGKIAPTPLPMARPDGSRTHLLTAETLPAAGADGWEVRSTAPEGTRRVVACQQATLVDIGALHAVIRVFDGPEGSGLRSRQLVARLADPKSAWRTHEVLRSWRAECDTRPADPTRHGIVREGRWLSVVEITATEGDVPDGWTRRAVRRIAATFDT